MKCHDRILQIPAKKLVHSRGRCSNGVIALLLVLILKGEMVRSVLLVVKVKHIRVGSSGLRVIFI
jgi:hypothetical protein